MSKKVISLLLAVMLTAAMIVVAAISVSADTDDEGSYVPSEGTETYHIYFCKPDDWENKYTSDAGVYWENGSDTPSAWPGYSARNADIKNVYCSDVPTDVDKVIWNNALKGTDDPTNPEYKLAYRTTDINFKGYDKGESDYYPNGVESFDNMIYIINPEFTTENDKDELILPVSGSTTTVTVNTAMLLKRQTSRSAIITAKTVCSRQSTIHRVRKQQLNQQQRL